MSSVQDMLDLLHCNIVIAIAEALVRVSNSRCGSSRSTGIYRARGILVRRDSPLAPLFTATRYAYGWTRDR